MGAFRVAPEHDLDIDHDTLDHLRDEGLVETVDLGDDDRGLTLTREGQYCAFTGTVRGQNSREFIASFVARGFAASSSVGPVGGGRCTTSTTSRSTRRSAKPTTGTGDSGPSAARSSA